ASGAGSACRQITALCKSISLRQNVEYSERARPHLSSSRENLSQTPRFGQKSAFFKVRFSAFFVQNTPFKRRLAKCIFQKQGKNSPHLPRLR
ncbi:MAG: hypothetical protein IJB41_09245, partial [Clostridia bacterium]|nr:hypothetical protein [Clostridia bacterium]